MLLVECATELERLESAAADGLLHAVYDWVLVVGGGAPRTQHVGVGLTRIAEHSEERGRTNFK